MLRKRSVAALAALTLAGSALADGIDTTPGPPTTVTTNNYSTSSTSENIAKSCKGLTIDSANGTLTGACNKTDTDGNVVLSDASLNLDDVIHCAAPPNATYKLIAWGTTDTSVIANWLAKLDSTGKKYIVGANCKAPDGHMYGTHDLELSDTTDGLKNDAGAFAKR